MSNGLIDDFPKRVKMYLHGDKDSNWRTGHDIGLSEEAIRQEFKYALYEVEVEIEVNRDGTYKMVSVDGRTLAV
jgi:hypothetical protein